MQKGQNDIVVKPAIKTVERPAGASDELMFRRLSLPVPGGMTRRELAHFKKFGWESLR